MRLVRTLLLLLFAYHGAPCVVTAQAVHQKPQEVNAILDYGARELSSFHDEWSGSRHLLKIKAPSPSWRAPDYSLLSLYALRLGAPRRVYGIVSEHDKLRTRFSKVPFLKTKWLVDKQSLQLFSPFEIDRFLHSDDEVLNGIDVEKYDQRSKPPTVELGGRFKSSESFRFNPNHPIKEETNVNMLGEFSKPPAVRPSDSGMAERFNYPVMEETSVNLLSEFSVDQSPLPSGSFSYGFNTTTHPSVPYLGVRNSRSFPSFGGNLPRGINDGIPLIRNGDKYYNLDDPHDATLLRLMGE